MARYFGIHPANPQRRAIAQIADIVRAGGVIAYPTDSCYALGCQFGNKDGIAFPTDPTVEPWPPMRVRDAK